MLGQAGCSSGGDRPGQMVPRSQRKNSRGPSSRRPGDVDNSRTIPSNPRAMTAWDAWGRAALRDGDIVFRMGMPDSPSRLYPFSKISR